MLRGPNRSVCGLAVFALAFVLGSFTDNWERPGRQYPYFGDIGEHYQSMWHWLYSLTYFPPRYFFSLHSECLRNFAILLVVSISLGVITFRLCGRPSRRRAALLATGCALLVITVGASFNRWSTRDDFTHKRRAMGYTNGYFEKVHAWTAISRYQSTFDDSNPSRSKNVIWTFAVPLASLLAGLAAYGILRPRVRVEASEDYEETQHGSKKDGREDRGRM